ncbi:MAG: hypothetical protein J6C85_01220 [Alphaproteobacteria bacterium]|nr:hypothetical protein [Alphaproteobacteria bacterium]
MAKKYIINQLGRSMIEMLGVLAIVGILSIGGISAFQKAMNKHKINQVTEDLSQFINEVLLYSKDWLQYLSRYGGGNITTEIDFLVPAKWLRTGGYIYDSIGNKLMLNLRRDIGKPVLALDYILINRDEKAKLDLCMAYFNMAKSYSDRIFGGVIWRSDSDSNGSVSWFYGDGYCGRNKRCLKDLTLEEMRERCSVFQNDDKGSNFSLFFLL